MINQLGKNGNITLFLNLAGTEESIWFWNPGGIFISVQWQILKKWKTKNRLKDGEKEESKTSSMNAHIPWQAG